MTQSGLIRTAFVAILLIAQLSAAVPQECPSSCMVEIKGLRSSYSPGATIEFSVHNAESGRIEVNVALEALQSNKWAEIVASVTDPRHPLGKALRLSPIQAGARLMVRYRPLATKNQAEQIKRVGLPASFRLRVDIVNGGDGAIVQYVVSEPFQLTSEH